MKRDEVKAMTDKELRTEAGRLRGWRETTERQRHPVTKVTKHVWMYNEKRVVCGAHVLYPFPNYPNDIAAAMELVEVMRGTHDGHFTLFAFTTNWRAAPGTISDPQIDSMRMAEGETASLAITRAFILAMTGGDDE